MVKPIKFPTKIGIVKDRIAEVLGCDRDSLEFRQGVNKRVVIYTKLRGEFSLKRETRLSSSKNTAKKRRTKRNRSNES